MKWYARFGSMLDIFPVTNYEQFVPDEDATARMRSYWNETGYHVKNALGKYERQVKETSTQRPAK